MAIERGLAVVTRFFGLLFGVESRGALGGQQLLVVEGREWRGRRESESQVFCHPNSVHLCRGMDRHIVVTSRQNHHHHHQSVSAKRSRTCCLLWTSRDMAPTAAAHHSAEKVAAGETNSGPRAQTTVSAVSRPAALPTSSSCRSTRRKKEEERRRGGRRRKRGTCPLSRAVSGHWHRTSTRSAQRLWPLIPPSRGGGRRGGGRKGFPNLLPHALSALGNQDTLLRAPVLVLVRCLRVA